MSSDGGAVAARRGALRCAHGAARLPLRAYTRKEGQPSCKLRIGALPVTGMPRDTRTRCHPRVTLWQR